MFKQIIAALAVIVLGSIACGYILFRSVNTPLVAQTPADGSVLRWTPAPTVLPPKLEFSSDSKFAGAASVMAVSPALSNIVIYAGGSKPVATIHPDGTVELGGTPDEAARAFWHAVELMFPARCAKP